MSYTNGLDNPELYHQSKLYTGTGSELAITLDGDENMQPDLVWLKNRDEDEGHKIFDSVRGVTKFIMSNNTDAEATAAQTLKSFDSDGFTIGTDADMNTSSELNVAWCWKESATAGFDIVAWTGNGSSQDISHSLSAVPHFMITKNRSATGDWTTYHKFGGGTKTFYLSNTDAIGTTISPWNNTTPTSSVFTVGGGAYTNGSGNSIIGWLWTEKQGFSKFGSFVSNGNADGTFCYLGFRAAYILMKKSSGSGTDWYIFYNKSPGYNENNKSVRANTNHDEDQASGYAMDILSNGFKIRTDNTAIGESGATFVYAAFAEAPLVNSNGVPCNAR